jgi:excinuclease ABC subunit A
MIKSFNLISIGKICIKNNSYIIELHKSYFEALKYLDEFSHAVLIYSINKNKINVLKETIIEIESIDLKNGKIECKSKDLLNNSNVFDLKPYFPCEDRVRISNCSDVRSNAFSEFDGDSIIQAGTILREDGLYKLNLDNIGDIKNLNSCSHIKIFWWFNRFDKSEYRKTTLVNPPYEKAPRSGVFATRSPVRPNPIAMTTARILRITENEIYVTELDCFEGTPLIGILPYQKDNDYIEKVRVPEWLEHWPQFINDSEYKNGTINIISSVLEKIKPNDNFKISFNDEESIIVAKPNSIIVKGACQNNLKGIEATFPYGKITAVTGVSGSGKSSLAFDTIYMECKRRFSDISGGDLSIPKPEFDSFEGALPAVAISQKSIGRNPRSTVGSITGISDILRIIFATIGIRHCPDCGNAVIPMTVDEIELYVEGLKNDVRITDIFGNTYKSVKSVLNASNGVCYVSSDYSEPVLLQVHKSCGHCGKIMFDMTPSFFSYVNPESMCPVCHGYGVNLDVNINAIVSRPDLSLLDGASEWWGNLRSFKKNPNHNWMKGEIFALALDLGIDLEKPWKDLTEEFKKQAIFGTAGRVVKLVFENNKNGRNGNISRPVEGAYNCIKRLYKENSSAGNITKFMKQSKCDYCDGERLNRESRMVTVAGKRYPEISSATIEDVKSWCEKLPFSLSNRDSQAVLPLLSNLRNKLKNCIELGIGYLSLDRNVPTLSGGELQRLKLVSQIENNMSGILYVMDEPAACLHPKDYQKLIKAIYRLKDKGNTVLLIDHNKDIIKLADKIIDVGPEAGENGGRITAVGTIKELIKAEASETGKYLSGKKEIRIPSSKNKSNIKAELKGVYYNNLKEIDVAFPHGKITCITGVSGSGKSSLLKGSLYPSAEKGYSVNCTEIKNMKFNGVIFADQYPIGKSPNSVPATYMGIMDIIRDIFAKNSSLSASYFSFNSPMGQCENCHGDGELKMEFLQDVWIKCPVCNGKRYKKQVLDVLYKGKNIYDMLKMSVKEAYDFFSDNPFLEKLLSALINVGLGYLKLGQNSVTLSGGEAQRLKLAKNLCETSKTGILFILDEPTTGLHYSDIQNLMLLLRQLADKGNTILMIEHNMDVIQNADWIIDLGLEGGNKGGYLVAQGIPSDIINSEKSFTGMFLKKVNGKNIMFS